jgi:8-oxo-dGTP pyrophosphatase MutT (NUDIX family)
VTSSGRKENRREYAAVAAILKFGSGLLEVLVVKRAENPLDPWSGDWALPGGMMKPLDRDLLQTVIREVKEETSIDLARSASLIRELDYFATSIRPWLRVKPYVFKLLSPVTVRLSHELTSYAWLDLLSLKEGFDEKGKIVYRFDKGVIWGMTARIIRRLRGLVIEEKLG